MSQCTVLISQVNRDCEFDCALHVHSVCLSRTCPSHTQHSSTFAWHPVSSRRESVLCSESLKNCWGVMDRLHLHLKRNDRNFKEATVRVLYVSVIYIRNLGRPEVWNMTHTWYLQMGDTIPLPHPWLKRRESEGCTRSKLHLNRWHDGNIYTYRHIYIYIYKHIYIYIYFFPQELSGILEGLWHTAREVCVR